MIAVDIARDDADLLVVTENGYGKRTRVADYPVKGRGGLGVKTVQLIEAQGHARRRPRRPRRLPGDADLRRRHRDPHGASRTSSGSGRSTQGVIVMRLREGEQVSTLAPVVTGDEEEAVEQAAAAPAGEPTAADGPELVDEAVLEDELDAADDEPDALDDEPAE